MTGNAMPITEPYHPRPIRFRELWSVGPFRVKVYGIAYNAQEPGERLVDAGKAVARERLLAAADTEHYGVAFLGIHQGKTGNFVFIDWWAHENELHHHVFIAPADAPLALEYAGPADPIACVWDLALIGHERQAWVDCVLKRPEGPDLEGYLQRRMSAEV